MKKFVLTPAKIKDNLPFIIFFLSFVSEIVHGILTHEIGTSEYAFLTVGEVIRGFVFVLVVGYAFLTVQHQASRVVLIALGGMVLWIFTQALAFQFTFGEIISTLLRGVRWLYLFFLLNWLIRYIRHRQLSSETVITQLKWLILIFYCVPIFLSAAGIAGYTVYGDDSSRMGFGGFVMNSNVVASMMLFMLPFYLRLESRLDWGMLLVYVGAAFLLGSKLTWIGFAGVLGTWLAWKLRKAVSVIARTSVLRIRRVTGSALVLLALVIGALPFTPIIKIVIGIYQGLVGLYQFFVIDNGFGYGFTWYDLLTSGRTRLSERLFEWAQQPGNDLMLFIGGGLPNYTRFYSEVDWVDLTALFGILGVVLFYSVIFLFLWNAYKSRRPYHQEVFWMLALSFAISLTSGHTYDGPAVGMVIAGVLGAFWGQKYQRSDTALADESVEPTPFTASGDEVKGIV